jgi:hypothetical protein
MGGRDLAEVEDYRKPKGNGNPGQRDRRAKRER